MRALERESSLRKLADETSALLMGECVVEHDSTYAEYQYYSPCVSGMNAHRDMLSN